MNNRPDYRHTYIGELSKDIGKKRDAFDEVSGFVVVIVAVALIAFGLIAVEMKIHIDKAKAEIERSLY